jgi:hypothetical protein
MNYELWIQNESLDRSLGVGNPEAIHWQACMTHRLGYMP